MPFDITHHHHTPEDVNTTMGKRSSTKRRLNRPEFAPPTAPPHPSFITIEPFLLAPPYQKKALVSRTNLSQQEVRSATPQLNDNVSKAAQCGTMQDVGPGPHRRTPPRAVLSIEHHGAAGLNAQTTLSSKQCTNQVKRDDTCLRHFIACLYNIPTDL